MVKTGSERETDRQVNKHLQTEKIESERERVVVREMVRAGGREGGSYRKDKDGG